MRAAILLLVAFISAVPLPYYSENDASLIKAHKPGRIHMFKDQEKEQLCGGAGGCRPQQNMACQNGAQCPMPSPCEQRPVCPVRPVCRWDVNSPCHARPCPDLPCPCPEPEPVPCPIEPVCHARRRDPHRRPEPPCHKEPACPLQEPIRMRRGHHQRPHRKSSSSSSSSSKSSCKRSSSKSSCRRSSSKSSSSHCKRSSSSKSSCRRSSSSSSSSSSHCKPVPPPCPGVCTKQEALKNAIATNNYFAELVTLGNMDAALMLATPSATFSVVVPTGDATACNCTYVSGLLKNSMDYYASANVTDFLDLAHYNYDGSVTIKLYEVVTYPGSVISATYWTRVFKPSPRGDCTYLLASTDGVNMQCQAQPPA